MVKYSAELLRIIAPEVGGGFGSKIVWYPELFLTPLISKWIGKPVKFISNRSDSMLTMSHGRDQLHEIDFSFDKVNSMLLDLISHKI